jgi:hypothetical protein
MNPTNPYKAFVARYLTRGAVGVSVGLAAIAPTTAAQRANVTSDDQGAKRSFGEKLQIIRSTISDLQSTKVARGNSGSQPKWLKAWPNRAPAPTRNQ